MKTKPTQKLTTKNVSSTTNKLIYQWAFFEVKLLASIRSQWSSFHKNVLNPFEVWLKKST